MVGGTKWRVTANGYGVSYRGDRNIQELSGIFHSGDGCTPCDYTKNTECSL